MPALQADVAARTVTRQLLAEPQTQRYCRPGYIRSAMEESFIGASWFFGASWPEMQQMDRSATAASQEALGTYCALYADGMVTGPYKGLANAQREAPGIPQLLVVLPTTNHKQIKRTVLELIALAPNATDHQIGELLLHFADTVPYSQVKYYFHCCVARTKFVERVRANNLPAGE